MFLLCCSIPVVSSTTTAKANPQRQKKKPPNLQEDHHSLFSPVLKPYEDDREGKSTEAVSVQPVEGPSSPRKEEEESSLETLTEQPLQPPQKEEEEARSQKEKDQKSALQLLFDQKDIWFNHIFPHVGMGWCAFVAPVNKQMKNLYQEYCNGVKHPPPVVIYACDGTRPATSTDTFYSSAFFNQACAIYWLTTGDNRSRRPRSYEVCHVIAKTGSLDMLQWAHHQVGFPWSDYVYPILAGGGHLDVMKWAHANGRPWNYRAPARACIRAAMGGHLDVLKWAHDNCDDNNRSLLGATQEICPIAAKRGDLEMLLWAHLHGCSIYSSTLEAAAGSGQLETFQYAYWHIPQSAFNPTACSLAARGGHLEVLQWARQNGCPWDHKTIKFAKSSGHTEVEQWARDHGCPEETV